MAEIGQLRRKKKLAKRKPEPSMHRKRMAVEFWKSGKKGPLKLDTVRHNFSFVTSRVQLHHYEKQIMVKEKFIAVRLGILFHFKAAKHHHLVVHDRDLGGH
ncbi:hypothetical protein J437_LFUL003964 [Ladona fulva]|uniref:Uncharacterized protein n=1 Tax=Ladona fulva TaxID=123851 RepID=A0A8K0K782_LADFU|nr:hypothetical protein J437_LFUL003964 [Ladona fulva]